MTPIKNLPLLTGAELAAWLDKREEVETFFRAVYGEAMSRAESGSADRAPGWKLAEGRKGDRTANPDDIARRAMEVLPPELGGKIPSELFTAPQLKSVAQLEGACKKLGTVGKAIWKAITGDPEKGVPSLITQASGKPTLVRDFDARPELAPQPVTFELRPVGEEFSKADATEGLF